MIHYLATFSRRAADGPFGDAVRDSGLPHRIIAGDAQIQYRNRLELVFLRLPRLALFSLRAAFRSLLFSHPPPKVVILNSDVEVVAFHLLRTLLLKRRTRLVLSSFIFTSRRARWAKRIRRAYYGWVLGKTDLVIVHSRLETRLYPELFPGSAGKFTFVGWGGSMHRRTEVIAAARSTQGPRYIISAGRSGRDYTTLIEAVRGLGVELRIVCDYAAMIPPLAPADRVTLLQDCYGMAYFRQMAEAAVVAVPLEVENISAGQMVVVQAMGLGRPIVATDTPTIRDYLEDGRTALLVPPKSAGAMRQAIEHLLGDSALAAELGSKAMQAYDAGLDTPGHIRHLLREVERLL